MSGVSLCLDRDPASPSPLGRRPTDEATDQLIIDRPVATIRAARHPVRRRLARWRTFSTWAAARLAGRSTPTNWYPRYRAGRAEGPKFLLRVDDYPHWEHGRDAFVAFHRILATRSLRYLLATTPLLAQHPLDPICRHVRALTAEDRDVLARVVAEGGEIALHGISHRTRPGRWRTELIGLDGDELSQALDCALDQLEVHGGRIAAFVPPFNSFDLDTVAALGRRFAVVCGGPESARTLGAHPFPARFGGGPLYVPSYPPAYGTAGQVIRFVRRLRESGEPALVPLTLHWSWEVANAFRDVEELARELEGRTVPWGSLSTLRAA